MNITLIGMPGSGKSFVGKALAETLGFPCVDFDMEMEALYGKPLQTLVDEWGEKLFIERESDHAIRTTAGRGKCIISPGGSIIYSPKAMEHLRGLSMVAYLKAPLALIEQRIGTTPRGIIGVKAKSLAELYAERIPLYERYAHAVFNADQDAEYIADEIISKFFS